MADKINTIVSRFVEDEYRPWMGFNKSKMFAYTYHAMYYQAYKKTGIRVYEDAKAQNKVPKEYLLEVVDAGFIEEMKHFFNTGMVKHNLPDIVHLSRVYNILSSFKFSPDPEDMCYPTRLAHKDLNNWSLKCLQDQLTEAKKEIATYAAQKKSISADCNSNTNNERDTRPQRYGNQTEITMKRTA